MAVGRVYLRKQNGVYYCKVDGKQVRLSPCKADAERIHRELMLRHGCPKDPAVRDICTLYLAALEVKESTKEKRKRILDSLCMTWGDEPARELTAEKLKKWMDERHPHANDTTKHDRYGVVRMAFNWAKAAGHVKTIPMAGLRRPKPGKRSVFVPRERWPELLEACNPQLRFITEFMLLSGARPQEARILLCSDWLDSRFVLDPSRSKGEEYGRTIYVPEEFARKVDAEVAEKSPSEHVFTNTEGRPWSKNGLVCSFRRLREKLGIEGLCPYVMRHSYAVDKLRLGAKPEFVAQCMGHTDTEMIYKRYGHMAQQEEQLRAVTELRGSATKETPTKAESLPTDPASMIALASDLLARATAMQAQQT